MFHISPSLTPGLPLRPFIAPVLPTPSRMLMKTSPSVEPWSHLSSVKSDGLASPPSASLAAFSLTPSPLIPWHSAQYLPYMIFPDAMDFGVAATGFFRALAFNGDEGEQAASAKYSIHIPM